MNQRRVRIVLIFIAINIIVYMFETCYLRDEGCGIFASNQKDSIITRNIYNADETTETDIDEEDTTIIVNSNTEKSICSRKQNVLFLKTHKTGSSTVTNILNRFGHERNLTFVLPRMGVNRLDWPWYFQNDSFYPLNGTIPNMLCNHARYNRQTMVDLMPNDTVYITILREPQSQFESTFSYMMFDKMLGMSPSHNDPIEEFFRDPQTVLMNYVLTQDLKINSERLKLIRNSMFYDLGLPTKDFENETRINETIAHLDKDFHLVMITEYFDESLVLLKRLLCWSLKDIAYFRLNQRYHEHKRNLSMETKEKVLNWNYADYRLYHHFKTKLEKVLFSLGDDFWQEVDEFKRLMKALSHICLEDKRDAQTVLLSADIKRLKLRRYLPSFATSLCKNMIRDEVAYLKLLREMYIKGTQTENESVKLNSYLHSLKRSVIEPVMSYFYL